MMHIEALL